MKKLISTFVTLALLLSSQTAFAYADFTDIPYGSEYYESVQFLLTSGAVAENDDHEFRPDDEITRAAFFKMVLADAGFDPSLEETEIYFEDTPEDAWYTPYANKAVEVGLIDIQEEAENYFNPEQTIKKAEAVRLILRWGGIATPLYISEDDWTLEYNDVIPEHPYATFIQKATELGIVQPLNSQYFGTYRKLTRGDATLLIYNLNIYTLTNDYISYVENGQAEVNVPLIDVLTDVYIRLNENFYQADFDQDELLYTTISEMVEYVGDDYTVFSAPEEAAAYAETLTGEYQGIGVYIEKNSDDQTVVTSFLANSPAEEAGMEVNDIIIGVDGVDITEMGLSELATLIKGEEGTFVTVTVLRDEEELEYTVERRALEASYLEFEILENDILYYELKFFGDSTDTEFFTTTNEILDSDQEIGGIIIDLRNNPGGYVDTAANILSFFIEENETIVSIQYNNSTTTYVSGGGAELKNYPVAVLINENSASASEIVSAALQEYEVATIIGQNSFGKGSAQELIYYEDGSSLKLTTAHWLTPNGNDLHDIGVIPDIEIELVEDSEEDLELEAAVDFINES